MANDRIYLQCTVCAEAYLLVKYWGGGEFCEPSEKAVDRPKMPLSSYLENHWKDCHEQFGSNLRVSRGAKSFTRAFRLVTEETAVQASEISEDVTDALTHWMYMGDDRTTSICGIIDGTRGPYSSTPTCPKCIGELDRLRPR